MNVDAEHERLVREIQRHKHQRLSRAEQIAMDAAWRDLPHNERVRYVGFALKAIDADERERTN